MNNNSDIPSTPTKNTSTSSKKSSEKYTQDERSYMGEVDSAWSDKGSRTQHTISFILFLLILTFVAWASWATVDEVTRGQGQVISSSRTQIISHLEGGILSDVLVTEGALVEVDQVLVRVENVAAASVFRDTQNKIWEHETAIVRLEAELNGTVPEFSQEVQDAAPQLVASEMQAYNSRRQQYLSEMNVQNSQLEQRKLELEEMIKREKSTSDALALANRRVELARPMLAQKLYAEVDFLNLQQEVVRLKGEVTALQNNITRTEQAIEEVELRQTLFKSEYDSNIIVELNKRQSEKKSLEESLTTGTDRVVRTEVRSPVRGKVNRIILNTKGGTVKPGEPIMEIVPIDDTLLVEARIKPSDIGFIYPNQRAVVKLTAYDYSIFGGLDAYVESIGADTIEGRNNDYYYLVKLRTDDISILYKGEELPIIPGMVASVDIITGKKTIMQYLLKPIIKAKDNALRER